MPMLVQGGLAVGGSIAVALLLLALVRKVVPREELEAAQVVSGDVVTATVSALYGVLVAFVLGAVLGNLLDTRLGATREIYSIGTLARLVGAMPSPARESLLAATREYTEQVLREEWPRYGQLSGSAGRSLDELWVLVTTFRPEDAREANLQSALIAQLETLSQQRRIRMLSQQARVLPTLVWSLLYLGGFIVVGLSTLSGMRSSRMQAVLVIFVASIVSLALFVIYWLGQPLDYRSLVSGEEIQRLRAFFEQSP